MAVNLRYNVFRWIGLVASVAIICISIGATAGSTYRFAFLFLVPIVWAIYWARERLSMLPSHYALFASAIVLHSLGAFGFYRRAFFGLQFDTYVHFYFGLCGAFLVISILEHSYRLRGWRLWVGVTIGILGFGAIHEMVEYASTLMLGPERGMLKALGDDPYDTQKDLLNNLLGTLVSLAIHSGVQQRRSRNNTQARTTAVTHPL